MEQQIVVEFVNLSFQRCSFAAEFSKSFIPQIRIADLATNLVVKIVRLSGRHSEAASETSLAQ